MPEDFPLHRQVKRIVADRAKMADGEEPINWGFAEVMAGDGKPATPIGRMGTKRDIANSVLFLASDAASFVSGQIFSVCGATTVDGLKMPLPE